MKCFLISREVLIVLFPKSFSLKKEEEENSEQGQHIMLELESNSPNNTEINGKICDNQLAMAEHFNNFFCTIGKRLAGKMENTSSQSVTRYLTNRVSFSIVLEPVDEREIISTINSLPMKKSVGGNNISVTFIKLVVNLIAPFLIKVINASFELGMFPNILKIAKVIPIYKSGDKQIINNYRPISLLSSFSKIYEKLIFNRFFKFLDKKIDLNTNTIRVSSSTFNTISNFRYYNNCLP